MKQIFLFFLFATNIILAQETCESPEDLLEDLNSITKCSIKSSKKSKDEKSRQISVKVSASKNRFLKKRILQKKAVASNLSTSGISNTNTSSNNLSNSLSIKEENPLDNIANLTNSLSAEEVRLASRFNNVDQIPLFTGCKNAKKDEKLNCFNAEMIKHIQKHFRYPNNAIINKIQGDVWVRFVIDKEGSVTNIKTLGPKDSKILDHEAIRVVSKLPKFIPGIKNKKNVSVKYGFPIAFSLED